MSHPGDQGFLDPCDGYGEGWGNDCKQNCGYAAPSVSSPMQPKCALDINGAAIPGQDKLLAETEKALCFSGVWWPKSQLVKYKDVWYATWWILEQKELELRAAKLPCPGPPNAGDRFDDEDMNWDEPY
jgi:hypothetical protein